MLCAGSAVGAEASPAVRLQLRPVAARDATFRKMRNQNQTDTNETATTETKYQTDFYSVEKYQYLTKF